MDFVLIYIDHRGTKTHVQDDGHIHRDALRNVYFHVKVIISFCKMYWSYLQVISMEDSTANAYDDLGIHFGGLIQGNTCHLQDQKYHVETLEVIFVLLEKPGMLPRNWKTWKKAIQGNKKLFPLPLSVEEIGHRYHECMT